MVRVEGCVILFDSSTLAALFEHVLGLGNKDGERQARAERIKEKSICSGGTESRGFYSSNWDSPEFPCGRVFHSVYRPNAWQTVSHRHARTNTGRRTNFTARCVSFAYTIDACNLYVYFCTWSTFVCTYGVDSSKIYPLKVYPEENHPNGPTTLMQFPSSRNTTRSYTWIFIDAHILN